MITISNGLSILRAPLAFMFLCESASLRLLAIVLAMLTDIVDGYLARRYRSASQFGAILDPAMDKFFVIFVLGVLLSENKIHVWEACGIISRDFFLVFFGIYLGLSGHWQAYQCKAIRWGKISTALQFLVLIALTLGLYVPYFIYILFFLFGALAFIELCQIKKESLDKNFAPKA